MTLRRAPLPHWGSQHSDQALRVAALPGAGTQAAPVRGPTGATWNPAKREPGPTCQVVPVVGMPLQPWLGEACWSGELGPGRVLAGCQHPAAEPNLLPDRLEKPALAKLISS